MRSMSNAFLWQVEVTQADRWQYGPMELLQPTIGSNSKNRVTEYESSEWNRSYRGGFLRPRTKRLFTKYPWIKNAQNPNIFFAPQFKGFTELHQMLASLLPDDLLESHGLFRHAANFWLSPIMLPGGINQNPQFKVNWDNIGSYAARCEAAFEQFIWARLSNTSRFRSSHFSSTHPFRVLANDTKYWMYRLYRIAVARNDMLGVVKKEDDDWEPLESLERKFFQQMDVENRQKFTLTRPYYGATLWDPSDPASREEVLDELLNGNDVIESLSPIIEAVLTQPAHDDFSQQHSWIKEDFERYFYKKRSKVKVTLVDTVDDKPIWDPTTTHPINNTVFRDILSFLNPRDKHIILAIRSGQTQLQIAKQLGHHSHAAISRQLKKIKTRLNKLLH